VIERVHGFYAERCPVARSIDRSIDITTQVEYTTTERAETGLEET
jgi:hypothetical protein